MCARYIEISLDLVRYNPHGQPSNLKNRRVFSKWSIGKISRNVGRNLQLFDLERFAVEGLGRQIVGL